MVSPKRRLFTTIALAVWAIAGLANAQYGSCPDLDDEEQAKCEYGTYLPTCCQSETKLRRDGDDDAYIHLLTCGEDGKLTANYCEHGCYNGGCNPPPAEEELVKGGTCKGLEVDMKCDGDFKPTCCDNPDEDSENETGAFTCGGGVTKFEECSAGCKNGKCNAPTDENGELRYGTCVDFNKGDTACDPEAGGNKYPMCCQTDTFSRRNGDDGINFYSLTCGDDKLLHKEECPAGCYQGTCNAPTTYGTCKDLNSNKKCDDASYPQCCRLPYSRKREDDGMVYYSQTCDGDNLKRERCEEGCSSGVCNPVGKEEEQGGNTKTGTKKISEYDEDSFKGDSSDPCNYFDANDYCSDDDELPRCCKSGKSVRDSKKGSWSLSCVNNTVQKHTCSGTCEEGKCESGYIPGEFGTCPDLNQSYSCNEEDGYPSCCKTTSNSKRSGKITNYYSLTCEDGVLNREQCAEGCYSGECNAPTKYGSCPDFNQDRKCNSEVTYPTCCVRSTRKRDSEETSEAQYSLTCPDGTTLSQEFCESGCRDGGCA